MSGMRAETINYDGQPTGNRRANMTSVLRHCKASDVRVAQEWCENGARVAQEWCESGARVAREWLQKSSARVAQGLRKSVRFAATILVLLFIGSGNVWGADATVATLAISSRPASTSETLTDDQSNSWEFTADVAPNTETNMIHIGTGSVAAQYIQLVCSGLSSKSISKIQVWAAAKSSTNVTAKIYIGDNLLGTSSELSNTSSSGGTEYSVTNTSNYSGSVKILISRPSSATGAIYFNKAVVTYTSGTKYTVTWNDNGGQIKSEEIAEGSTSYSCPSAPSTSARGNCGDKFMGWTTTANYSGNSAPTVLFTDDSGTKPAISGNTDFYAVFADEEK